MLRRSINALMSWVDAAMATAADAFIRFWTKVERAYKRPFSRVAFRLKFAFYPLLAIGAVLFITVIGIPVAIVSAPSPSANG